MNNLIQTDQELAKQLSDFGAQDDVEGMIDLLSGWKNKTIQWLFYVDTRIGMPSSTPQQKEALSKIKEQALAEDVQLLKEYEDFLVNDVIEFSDKDFAPTDNEPELHSFEFTLKDEWWNGYAEWAGCLLSQDEEMQIKDDIVYIGSGDGVLMDKRCNEGTYSFDHDNYTKVVEVTVLNAEEVGIDYSEQPIQRAVTTYELLKRYKWIASMFIPYNFEFEVYPLDFNDWESIADINASFALEIDRLTDDPWLAMYWLLHMGLSCDQRYEQVKDKIIAAQYEEQHDDILNSVYDALAWFEQHEIDYNFKVCEASDSEDMFLIRRANLIHNLSSYQYVNKDGFEQWWTAITLHPSFDEFSLLRMRWFANNLQKFEKWQLLDHKLQSENIDTKRTNIPFLSYALALHPNILDRSLFADRFLNELNLNQEVSDKGDHISLARTMLVELKGYYYDTKTLRKVMTVYFRGETNSKPYRELYDAHFEKDAELDSLNKTLTLLNKQTKGIDSKIRNVAKHEAYFSEIDKTLSVFDEASFEKLVEIIATNKLAYALIQYIFKSSLSNKTALLVEIFTHIYFGWDDNIRKYFKRLITDENDVNIAVIFTLIKQFNKNENCDRVFEEVFKNSFYQEIIFEQLLSLFDHMNPEEIDGLYKEDTISRILEETFTTIIKVKGRYVTHIRKLNELQKTALRKKCNETASRLHKRDGFYSYEIERIIYRIDADDSELKIISIEKQFGVQFPENYYYRIKDSNDLFLGKNWRLLPIADIPAYTKNERDKEGFPQDGVVIGYHQNSNLLVLKKKSKRKLLEEYVYKFIWKTAELKKVADDIGDFENSL